MLLTALAPVMALAAANVLPLAVPTGMDLLYSDRIPFTADGEPVVTVGLMSGQERVTVRCTDGLRLDFFDEGALKQAAVPSGQAVTITVARATPARLRYFADVAAIPWADAGQLEEQLAAWRARGYANVAAIAEGTALGIGGQLIDNREYHLVIPVESAAKASTLVTMIYERDGTRATVRTQLGKHPWARLNVEAAAHRLGVATSFVRFASSGAQPIEVADVEHGVGYAWHGRETRRFRGEIYIAVDPDGKLAAINVLGAEAVLAGVVPSEIFASAPPEALKAQAVAARNQLFAKLGRRHHAEPFHLCASQHCQVYAGLANEDARATDAVFATRGEVLFLGGRLVDTVYSSSCGGFSDNREAVWGDPADRALRAHPDFDVAAHPELAAFAGGIGAAMVTAWVHAYPATYCSLASKARREKFRWQRSFDRSALERLVAAQYPRSAR